MPDFLGQAVLNASGFGTVNISHNKPSLIWIIEQVTCSVGPSSTVGSVGVFKNNNAIAPAGILSAITTPFGSTSLAQTFAGDPYVPIQGSDTLEVVVSNATAGDTMTVRAQYREYPLYDPAVAGVLGGS